MRILTCLLHLRPRMRCTGTRTELCNLFWGRYDELLKLANRHDALFATPTGRVDTNADALKRWCLINAITFKICPLPQGVLVLLDDATVELLRTKRGTTIGIFQVLLNRIRKIWIVVHRGARDLDATKLTGCNLLDELPWLRRGRSNPMRTRSGTQTKSHLVPAVIEITPSSEFFQPR